MSELPYSIGKDQGTSTGNPSPPSPLAAVEAALADIECEVAHNTDEETGHTIKGYLDEARAALRALREMHHLDYDERCDIAYGRVRRGESLKGLGLSGAQAEMARMQAKETTALRALAAKYEEAT